MRSSLRSTKLRTSQNSFVCFHCRLQTLRPFLSSSLAPWAPARYASSSPDQDEKKKPEFTERLRRRIWGTDSPPGQRDPYKRMTPEERELEQAEMELEREQAKAKATEGVDEEWAQEEEVLEPQEYKPATTWDGLESIGGATGWWEETWDQENVFRGYLTTPTVTSEDLPNVLRRVTIEMAALVQAGRPQEEATNAPLVPDIDFDEIEIGVENGEAILRFEPPMEMADLLEYIPEEHELSQTADYIEEDLTESDEAQLLNTELGSDDLAAHEHAEGNDASQTETVVRANADGEDGEGAAVPKDIEELDNLVKEPEVKQAQAESELRNEAEAKDEVLFADDASETALQESEQYDGADSAEENEQIPLVKPICEHDSAYLSLPLTDPFFKFPFIKRLTHLTGTRIPDPAIASFKTIGDVLAHLQTPPPAKKLADVLLNMPTLTSLPNVEIFPRRHTPVDKEKQVGRWKVIEGELARRGLPVLGHTVQAGKL